MSKARKSGFDVKEEDGRVLRLRNGVGLPESLDFNNVVSDRATGYKTPLPGMNGELGNMS
jgi:hypothetical protein